MLSTKTSAEVRVRGGLDCGDRTVVVGSNTRVVDGRGPDTVTVVASASVADRSMTVSRVTVLLGAPVVLLVGEVVLRVEEAALRVDVVVLRGNEVVLCEDEVVPPVEEETGLVIPLGETITVATLFSSDSEASVTVVGVPSTASVVDGKRVLFEGLVVPNCLLSFSPKLRGYIGFPY